MVGGHSPEPANGGWRGQSPTGDTPPPPKQTPRGSSAVVVFVQVRAGRGGPSPAPQGLRGGDHGHGDPPRRAVGRDGDLDALGEREGGAGGGGGDLPDAEVQPHLIGAEVEGEIVLLLLGLGGWGVPRGGQGGLPRASPAKDEPGS